MALNRRIGAQCARGKERGTQGIDRLEIVPICCTLFGVFGPRSLSALRRTSIKLRLLSSLLVFSPHDLPSICFRLMCEYKIKISILFSSFSLFAHTQNDAFYSGRIFARLITGIVICVGFGLGSPPALFSLYGMERGKAKERKLNENGRFCY